MWVRASGPVPGRRGRSSKRRLWGRYLSISPLPSPLFRADYRNVFKNHRTLFFFPQDSGGGGGGNGKGQPDPKIRLGRLGRKKNFFRPSVLSLVRSRLLLLVWSKNKGGLPWIRQCRSPSPSPLMGSWPVSLVRIIGAPSPWSPFSTFSGIMNWKDPPVRCEVHLN